MLSTSFCYRRLSNLHWQTALGFEHVGEILLLDSTKVPDGNPTGVDYEKFNKDNYPDLAESELKQDFLPFLVRKCAVDQFNAFRAMKESFDRNGRFGRKGTILSKLSPVVGFLLTFSTDVDIIILC